MSPRNTASQAAGDPPLELGDLDDPAPQGDTAITRSHPPSICTISRLAEPVGEVTIRQWARMTAEQRSMYELGQTTVRSSVWKEMGKLGIQDNPIAKGRYLISQYGGRMGILIHASNPLNLIKTVGTGGTPMATHVGSFVANAARAGGSAYFTPLSSQFN